MISGKQILRYTVATFRMISFDLKGRVKPPWGLQQGHRVFHLWHWSMIHRIRTRVEFLDAVDMNDIQKAARVLHDM